MAEEAALMEAGEPARLAVLADYDLPLPAHSDASQLRSLAELAARLTGKPSGAINIISAEHQHQIAAFGIDPGVCSREDSMCARVFQSGTTTVVPDAAADPRFRNNPFVTGSIAAVRFYASVPLLTASGHALGTLCVFSDRQDSLTPEQQDSLEILAGQVVHVLELRHRTRRLDAALAEVRRSNASLAEFAGRVSHDLRTPLTTVIGYTELAETDPDVRGSAAEYLDTIARTGRRMLGMLDDVLSYSGIGGLLRPKELSLAALVEEVRQDLQGDIETAGALLTCSDAELYADPAQLRTLLQNLVSNAVNYRRADVPVRVHVAAESRRNETVLRVIDNGKGIGSGDRSRVLEPLVRLHRPGDPQGSGLGLATCSRIAAAHGGQLELSATAGGGTTVSVSIRAREGEQPATPERASADSGVPR